MSLDEANRRLAARSRAVSVTVTVTVTVLAACLVWLALAPSSAAADDATLRSLTPPDPYGATEVLVNLYDLQIFSIREQEEVFHLGGRLTMRWIDPRQAYDPEAVGTARLEFQGEAATERLKSDVWWPDLEFVDAIGPRELIAVNLTLDSDGEVWYRERFNAHIKQDFNLGDFPYDAHTISFRLEPFTYFNSAVRFTRNQDGESPTRWEPVEWLVSDPEIEIDDGDRHSCLAADGTPVAGPFLGSCEENECPGDSACDPLVGFPSITVRMNIARVPSYYNSNIILPMALIVLLGGAVFWMDRDITHLGDRLGLSFTSLLTVVAFDFVTSDSIPKLWYSTTLDRIITVSYVFMAVNIAATVLVDRWHRAGGRRELWAGRINRGVRWAFPAAYLGVLALLVLGS